MPFNSVSGLIQTSTWEFTVLSMPSYEKTTEFRMSFYLIKVSDCSDTVYWYSPCRNEMNKFCRIYGSSNLVHWRSPYGRHLSKMRFIPFRGFQTNHLVKMSNDVDCLSVVHSTSTVRTFLLSDPDASAKHISQRNSSFSFLRKGKIFHSRIGQAAGKGPFCPLRRPPALKQKQIRSGTRLLCTASDEVSLQFRN